MAVMVTRARSGCRDSALIAGAILLTAGVVSAVAFGFVLGAFGSMLDLLSRRVLIVGSLATLSAAALTRRRPWQLDRETAATWLAYRDWRTAALNGASLGLGFTTRLGVWLYYVLPLAAIAAAEPVTGAVILGTYASTRLSLSLAQVAIGAAALNRASRGFPLAAPATDLALFFIVCYVLTIGVSR